MRSPWRDYRWRRRLLWAGPLAAVPVAGIGFYLESQAFIAIGFPTCALTFAICFARFISVRCPRCDEPFFDEGLRDGTWFHEGWSKPIRHGTHYCQHCGLPLWQDPAR